MEVILDTNFVISCVREKLDFVNLSEELFDENMQFFLPEEVLKEIEKLSKRKGEKSTDKNAAKTAMAILNSLEKKGEIHKIALENEDVDSGLVNYVKMNPEEKFVLATLDRELKKKAGCRILTIRGKKMLELV